MGMPVAHAVFPDFLPAASFRPGTSTGGDLMEQNVNPQDNKQGVRYVCPFGKIYNRIIICSAPAEETGADPEWYTYDKKAHIVTRHFCAGHCRKTDVPKPVISEE